MAGGSGMGSGAGSGQGTGTGTGAGSGAGNGTGTGGMGRSSGAGATNAANSHGGRHHTSARAANTVQCGPHEYRLGIYGWRKRCLYALVLLLLVMVILNLALTLFILRVLDFTTEGMGGLQVVKDGVVAEGDVHIMDKLVAAKISSSPHTPIQILSDKNFTISALDVNGRVANSIVVDEDVMECTSGKFVIKDDTGTVMFSASRNEVLVGANCLTVTGEGGADFSGSVQTPHVTAPVSDDLLLESATRGLQVSAPQGVALESKAGTITAECLNDFILQSIGGIIRFDTPNIFVSGLRTSTITMNEPSRARPDVYQVCVCSNGKLFLTTPGGVCAADHDFCK